MQLSQDALLDLQKILKKEYGEDVSLEETEKIAQDLLNVLLICSKK